MISESLTKSLLSCKCTVDSLIKATEMVENTSLPEDGKEKMKAELAIRQAELGIYQTKLLRKIPDGSNYIQIQQSWYGIRVKSREQTTEGIEIHAIIGSLFLLERDGRKSKDLTPSELKAILADCCDKRAVEKYEADVYASALNWIKTMFGRPWDPALEIPSQGAGEFPSIPRGKGKFSHIRVSSHAGSRFVQRKLGLCLDSQSLALTYYQEHVKEVDVAILAALDKSKELWEDEDGVSYWFDTSDNMVYVIGTTPSPAIVTMYEEDFGWGKERNRFLVLEQAKDLKKIKKNIGKMESDYDTLSKSNLAKRDEIDAEIAVLSAKIDLLKASYDKLLAQDEEAGRALALERKRLIKECGKLFSDRETKRLRVD